VSAYRDEVEQAIQHAASDNRGLLDLAGMDRDGCLEWRDNPQECLRALVELGVRLGLQAAAAVASSRVQTGRPSSEGTVPIIGGADYHRVAQEIARLSPADVLLRKP
jgi:hypothetical protein